MSLFAKFNLRIIIDDQNHSKGSLFAEDYANALRGIHRTMSENLFFPRNKFLQITDLYPQVFIVSRIQSIARQFETNAYISDYQETDGSLIITSVLILETLINYDHIREAIEKIEEDLDKVLNIPGYTADVNIKGRIPRHATGSTNRHAVISGYTRMAIMVFALIGAFFLTARYLSEEKKAEKIEVVITNGSDCYLQYLGYLLRQ